MVGCGLATITCDYYENSTNENSSSDGADDDTEDDGDEHIVRQANDRPHVASLSSPCTMQQSLVYIMAN